MLVDGSSCLDLFEAFGGTDTGCTERRARRRTGQLRTASARRELAAVFGPAYRSNSLGRFVQQSCWTC